MALEITSKLNRLLTEHTPGGLFFSGWLVKNGYSAQLTEDKEVVSLYGIESRSLLGRDA